MNIAALASPRLWAAMAAVICGLAVLMGAYGWHSLEGDADLRDIFMLAVQYHMWHGLALFVIAWLSDAGGRAGKFAAAAGAAFLAGIFLFSVNLYVQATAGDPLVPGMVPVGGFALMAGWALLAISCLLRGPKASAG